MAVFYFMLASFYVDGTFLKTFSSALLLRVLTFVTVCWSGSATEAQKNTVRKTGAAASKLQAIDPSSPLDMYKHRSLKAEKKLVSLFTALRLQVVVRSPFRKQDRTLLCRIYGD